MQPASTAHHQYSFNNTCLSSLTFCLVSSERIGEISGSEMEGRKERNQRCKELSVFRMMEIFCHIKESLMGFQESNFLLWILKSSKHTTTTCPSSYFQISQFKTPQWKKRWEGYPISILLEKSSSLWSSPIPLPENDRHGRTCPFTSFPTPPSPDKSSSSVPKVSISLSHHFQH